MYPWVIADRPFWYGPPIAAMHLTPIGDLAEVAPVLEQMGERSHAEADTAAPAAIATAIDFGPHALPIELREQSPHGAKLQISCENGAHHLRSFYIRIYIQKYSYK
jgi:hypothetical protein